MAQCLVSRSVTEEDYHEDQTRLEMQGHDAVCRCVISEPVRCLLAREGLRVTHEVCFDTE